jgi:hypothetical protein
LQLKKYLGQIIVLSTTAYIDKTYFDFYSTMIREIDHNFILFTAKHQ